MSADEEAVRLRAVTDQVDAALRDRTSALNASHKRLAEALIDCWKAYIALDLGPDDTRFVVGHLLDGMLIGLTRAHQAGRL